MKTQMTAARLALLLKETAMAITHRHDSFLRRER
jgi:hypothetical protein